MGDVQERKQVFPQDVAKEILILAKGHGSSLDGLLAFFQLCVSSFLGSLLLRNSPTEAQVYHIWWCLQLTDLNGNFCFRRLYGMLYSLYPGSSKTYVLTYLLMSLLYHS